MKPPMPTPAALNDRRLDGPVTSAAHALPPGTRLDEFEIGEIISGSSVTIVYAATDRTNGAPTAIEEYMPVRLARRDVEAKVVPRTGAQGAIFGAGLRAFISETRALARCNHPSLVRIERLWEANATAYRAMPRYNARRLLEVRSEMNEPPDEAALRALLDALLGALEAFHPACGGHGKVTPSNILLQDDGRPLLLGPGASGRAIADDGIEAVMASTRPCFAPIEQIVEAGARLDPTVDLYALAGVARYWMSGELPPPIFGAPGAARRETVARTVQRLQLAWPRSCYSASLIDALDNALSIYPAQRPRSVAEMRARLDAAPAVAGRSVSPGPITEGGFEHAAPSSPASSQPAPATHTLQDRDVVSPSAPDPDLRATSGAARVDSNSPAPPAFVHQGRNRRRIAMWSGPLLITLALVLIGMHELRQDYPLDRVLDFLRIRGSANAGGSAPVSTSAAGVAVPATSPSSIDAEATKPRPTEPGTPSAGVGVGAAESASAVNAEAPATSPSPANAGATESAPMESNGSESPAPAEPVAVVQSPAVTAPPATKQHASDGPASPREACGKRTQFSMYRCMQNLCSQPRWAKHAQCEHLRATDSVD
jgi:serine/threonine protein kinase